MSLDFQLMPHQVDFVVDCTTPIVGFVGGMGMGKSEAAVHKAILLSALHPGKTGMLMSPTFGMTQRNLVPIFRKRAQDYGLNIKGLDAKHPDELQIKWGDATSTIHLQVTAESHDRMNGLNLAWAGFDEADKANPIAAALAAEQMMLRCREPAPGRGTQIFITSTPEGQAFMYSYFVEQESPRKKLYKASMLDNYTLPKDFRTSMLTEIPAHKREAYINGEFVSLATDKVYTDFDSTLNNSTLTLADCPNDVFWVSFDLNLGGMSCVIGVDRGDEFHIIHELMGQQDTKTLLTKVAMLVPKERTVITCDPASSQVQPYIRDAGFKQVKIMSAAPHVEWRVSAVNRKFCDGNLKRKLLVNTRTCRVLSKALAMQQYVNGAPDKRTYLPEAKTDVSGPLDALGYLIYLRWPYKPTGPATIRLSGF